MAIHIFIKSGVKKGKSFNVKDGMRLGREGQDVNLEDPKASTLHAMPGNDDATVNPDWPAPEWSKD